MHPALPLRPSRPLPPRSFRPAPPRRSSQRPPRLPNPPSLRAALLHQSSQSPPRPSFPAEAPSQRQSTAAPSTSTPPALRQLASAHLDLPLFPLALAAQPLARCLSSLARPTRWRLRAQALLGFSVWLLISCKQFDPGNFACNGCTGFSINDCWAHLDR